MFSPPAHGGETSREVPLMILGRFIHSATAPLKNTYDCYRCLREDIEKRNFEMFAFHLSYFKDKVSDRMRTSIDTCLCYLDFIKNSFTYDYSNGPIEGINNFIKVLKRIAFGYRNFANFRTRIFITRNLLID